MSTSERFQRGHPLPSFEGEAQAFADRERSGEDTALPIAIAEAATAAAAYMAEAGIETPLTFQVSRILVVVSPNPGPTTYRALLTPGG
jgi:hypothetical protein